MHMVVGAVGHNRHGCFLGPGHMDIEALVGAAESVDTVVDTWLVLHELDRRVDCYSLTKECFPLGCQICYSDRLVVLGSDRWECCDALGLIEVDLVAITVC